MRSASVDAVYRSVERLQVAVSSIMVPLRLTPRIDVPFQPFQTRFGSAAAGEVVVTRIEGARGQVDRSRKLITSTDPELFVIMLDRRGSVIVEQDGHQDRIRRGELVVLDTTRPYRARYDDPCDAVVLTAPWAAFGLRVDALRRRTAARLAGDSGTGAVISAFLTGLGEQLGHLPGPSGFQFGEALTTLLVAGICETTPDRVGPAVELTDKITAYALANIADPGLCVEAVARRFAISPSKLHRLFRQRDDTFAAWVREERLQRIRRDLLDPAFAHRTIATVAARWGLYDPAHLSRLFKARFGQTPAQMRRLRSGTPFTNSEP
ncbi:helix-turn-helix domain-containing protein [Streptomyces sp. NPDC102467]|uniref:AraC-like ligand-binding domain-containing protein n=1 Tax=Streptomyces sp. NPDC102467 TaxID=3366179 RepID=UPI0037F96547